MEHEMRLEMGYDVARNGREVATAVFDLMMLMCSRRMGLFLFMMMMMMLRMLLFLKLMLLMLLILIMEM